MPYMLVRHKVQDFDRWKPALDAHRAQRKPMGFCGGQLFRVAGDPHEVVILFEVADLERARQFAASDDLREIMQRAGVMDRPDIYFLEEAETFTD